eukprot:GHVL01044183.1.p1 GENE.GHVL01044183.1~~GHVL01044183.1.p1  ORF type:complete len:264 (-),score=44.21 GHVL01044183.1:187-978(-)
MKKTPSFTINRRKGLYYCFGCHKGGDLINFVQQTQNVDFQAAIKILCQFAGIPYPSSKENNVKFKEELDLHKVLVDAMGCFSEHLMNPRAQNYLKERDSGWNTLYQVLQSKGHSIKLSEQSGLIATKSNRSYDVFRDRLMIPITNASGKLVGFGGRSIGDQQPKYLNSPENSLFRKKSLLYGYSQTLSFSPKTKNIFVVEGYLDVLALMQAGWKNVVALLGTACGVEQLRLLFKHYQEVIMVFDGDGAGEKAAFSAIKSFITW